jgi:hypothetical protein
MMRARCGETADALAVNGFTPAAKILRMTESSISRMPEPPSPR